MTALLRAASEALQRNDAVALETLLDSVESVRLSAQEARNPELLSSVLRLTAQIQAAERGLAACGRTVAGVHLWAR